MILKLVACFLDIQLELLVVLCLSGRCCFLKLLSVLRQSTVQFMQLKCLFLRQERICDGSRRDWALIHNLANLLHLALPLNLVLLAIDFDVPVAHFKFAFHLFDR